MEEDIKEQEKSKDKISFKKRLSFLLNTWFIYWREKLWKPIKKVKKILRATFLLKQTNLIISIFLAGYKFGINFWAFVFIYLGLCQLTNHKKQELLWWINFVFCIFISGSQIGKSFAFVVLFFFFAVTHIAIIWSEPDSLFKNKVSNFYTQLTKI